MIGQKTDNKKVRKERNWAILIVPLVIISSFAIAFTLLSNGNAKREARSQAYSQNAQMWEEKVVAARTPQERWTLLKIRSEVRGKNCHPSYSSESLEAYETKDVGENFEFIKRQERHCLEVLMGQGVAQKNPEQLIDLVEGML